ncbi:hypothetical protein [Aeromonas caviae]|uniref:hypothetical protein n=1 Tax=Aeromonas caviae TaxID=648 RepID=UPI00194254AA|nr:hypothetical protein [Aeromonas caviae]BCR31293.1 hypothetical protein KAM376_42990 [Aeromonas caviae]GJA98285.1 hypothetical protein KAM359_16930 [Aeromonas caviae]GJB41607.1 hypothetical protein KAM369_20820 [Aeromonas caviae]GJB45737.1 hypothetical protein KAM370_16790 [Aeromonas caviae]GJB50705.1 hypothetical protein KAM372_21660 [Aeromonas caviae]
MASLLARLRKLTSRLRPKATEVRVASVARCPGKSRFEREHRKTLADDLQQHQASVSMPLVWSDEAPIVSCDAPIVSHRDNDSSYHSRHSSSSSSSSSSDSDSSYHSSSRHSSSDSDYSSSSSDSGGSCSSD